MPTLKERLDDADNAYGYLSRLLLNCAPQCEVLPTLSGLATQIDNLIAGYQAQIAKYKGGNFTKEEIHNICHNLHGTVSAEEFAAGCAEEQRKLYGCAPDRDRAQARQLVDDILESRKDDLTKAACDECEHCGKFAMCSYHSVLSELQLHVMTEPAIKRLIARGKHGGPDATDGH